MTEFLRGDIVGYKNRTAYADADMLLAMYTFPNRGV